MQNIAAEFSTFLSPFRQQVAPIFCDALVVYYNITETSGLSREPTELQEEYSLLVDNSCSTWVRG
jgi:hypothetical protein